VPRTASTSSDIAGAGTGVLIARGAVWFTCSGRAPSACRREAVRALRVGPAARAFALLGPAVAAVPVLVDALLTAVRPLWRVGALIDVGLSLVATMVWCADAWPGCVLDVALPVLIAGSSPARAYGPRPGAPPGRKR